MTGGGAHAEAVGEGRRAPVVHQGRSPADADERRDLKSVRLGYVGGIQSGAAVPIDAIADIAWLGPGRGR